jgi:hypothetical protein
MDLEKSSSDWHPDVANQAAGRWMENPATVYG